MKNKQPLLDWITITLREAAWAPLCVVGIYIFGLAFDLFDLYPWSDIPTHFLGGMAITYFYCSAVWNSQKILGDIPLPIQILLAFTATGTTTILWEFYENFIDYFFGFHTVRGLGETIMDIAMGLSGALVLSLFYKYKKH